MEKRSDISVIHTPIEDLLVFRIPVHGDSRGWFKENWQREKMIALGLPDFAPVQNNVSFNAEAGTTRGLHAEPWDKLVSVGAGSVYGAWCDLREDSNSYGQTFAVEITPEVIVYVPRGVANGFQALQNNTVYTYLVNDHWSPTAKYSNVNLRMIEWPLEITEISEKDLAHPDLRDATPVPAQRILITGAGGQLGRALKEIFPTAEFVSRTEFDISSPEIRTTRNWKEYSTIINAAAFTNVDESEISPEKAWSTNANGVATLVEIARKHAITFVHISSDYVFDGKSDKPYDERSSFSPINVYGHSKAAGDLLASTLKKHYILRTSWVIGDGDNFVRTMMRLCQSGINPKVVNDQIGRLTFTPDLAAGIKHLLTTGAEYGTYNLTNSGKETSWADIAQVIYSGGPNHVEGISSNEYFQNYPNAAKRPRYSVLDLTKIEQTGYVSPNWLDRLSQYISEVQ